MWIYCTILALLRLLTFVLATPPGHSDKPVSCLSEQFKCHDGTCIAGQWWCDGDSDCSDGEDEEGCGNFTCSSDKFQCKNGRCIGARLVCNGHNDCKDDSDEIDCQPKHCSSGEFRCGLKCVFIRELCDGKTDCIMKVNGIQNLCKPVPRPQCTTGEFVCDGQCVPGTWKCDGHPDCQDAIDEKNCEPFMLIFNTSVITKMDLALDRSQDVSLGHGKIFALSSGTDSGEVFGIDGEQKIIFRKSIGDHTEKSELIKNLERATCLSVDWIYRLIFWIDSDSRTIAVVSLDGLKRRTLYEGNMSLPSAIAVDPLNGFIFWSDLGADAKIEKAAMNGESRSLLVNEDIVRPVALSLDLIHNNVYWADAELNTINRIGINGNARKELLCSKELLGKPSGIAVFKDTIYWTNVENNAIYSMQRQFPNNIIAVQSVRNPIGLIIFAKEIQLDDVSVCILERAKCPFLCVPSPPGSDPLYSCLLPDNSTSNHSLGLPQNVNATNEDLNEIFSKWHLGIAVSVLSCVFVIAYVFLQCYKKTKFDLRNIRFLETSKNYLKPDWERTTSTTYMLTELKNEEPV